MNNDANPQPANNRNDIADQGDIMNDKWGWVEELSDEELAELGMEDRDV